MSGNIEQALDLGQGVYTQAEIDAIPSSLSKVASNVLMEGNLALASSAVTKSNANVKYTGQTAEAGVMVDNGDGTWDVLTGISSVDFTVASNGSGYYHDRAAGDCIVKNDAGVVVESGSCVVNVSKVHIKGRSVAWDNVFYDGLRGVYKRIMSNLTSIETSNSTALTSFNSNGFSIGSYLQVNENLGTFIAHQTLYTHIKWGLTNQGKRYITAYNPVTREVMTMYQGSGIAGHQIPNALGIKLDFITGKNLSSSWGWPCYLRPLGASYFGWLHNTDAFTTNVNVWNNTEPTEDTIYLSTEGAINTSGNSFILYGFANSETKIITQYQGTGASGNFVETKDVNGVAKKPRRVIIKRTDSIGDWHYTSSNMSSNRLELNTPDAEGGGLLSFAQNGFNPDWISAINASGGQYIAIVEFDTTSNNDDTYFDLPTDDTNLNVTAGKLPYTDGRDTTNGAYNVFTQSYTGSVDFSTCPDGIHYVALDSNNAPKFYEKVAIGLYEKEAADDNRLVFDTESGKWFTTTGGELALNPNFENQDLTQFSGDASYSIDSNNRLQVTDNTGSKRITFTIPTEIGEEYWLDISGTKGTYQIYAVTGTTTVYYTYTGEHRSFIANSAVTSIHINDGSSGTDTFYLDRLGCYKIASTLDTALTTPISFIDDKPYQVASGTPMDRLVDYPSIPKNVMESSYVDGDLEVSGNLSGMSGFDLGQSWQVVTASRSAGVTYTNTTGKPIEVFISGSFSGGGFVNFTINGLNINLYESDYDIGQWSFIVPNNETYILENKSWAHFKWYELR